MTALDLDANVGDLSWADVDPARTLDVDLERAKALAADALMDTPRGNQRWRQDATTEIGRRFARAFGPWTCGWNWASNGGGVVSAWCCSSHSLMPKGPHEGLEETAARAANALFEWRAWLVRLAALFRQLDGGVEVSARALAAAASRIVELVVQQTHAEDAWYSACAQVLGWFLESQGIHPRDAELLVERAIGGRFESWVGPSAATRHEVAEILGSVAAGALGAAGVGDAGRAADGRSNTDGEGA